MFSFSVGFVALLAGLSSATPVMEARGGPPDTDDTCLPLGLNTTLPYFIRSSSIPTMVWQAVDVEADKFVGVGLVAKTNASVGTQEFDNQVWTPLPVNNGNAIAIVSAGTAVSTCVNGDGGPLDSLGCSDIFATKQIAQSAQFFITCKQCATDHKSATGCQIQSASDGQCASFLLSSSNAVKLDDCSSTQPNQFWDIVSGV